EPALPLFLRQPGPGLTAATALLAGTAFRGWCSMAVPPAVALNACGWSWRSVLAQAFGLALLRALWALFGERRAWAGFLAEDFRRNLLLWCLLGVLIGAARWVWFPLDLLDGALRPLALLCGMPVAWGIAASVLGIVVIGERRSPCTY